MDEKQKAELINKLHRRWAELESRAIDVYEHIIELDQIDSTMDDKPVKSTAIYKLLKLETRLIGEEQEFVEGLHVLLEINIGQ